MNRIVPILLMALFVTPLLAINASAANKEREVTYEDFEVSYHYSIPTNPIILNQENFEYKSQICGYDELGVRGECDSTANVAPNELWFNYQITMAPNGTWPGFGDYVRFNVDNNPNPAWVDVNVYMCWEPTDNHGILMCVKNDVIEQNEDTNVNMQTMRSNNWFIRLVADAGGGGDETEVSVKYNKYESSLDRLEPEIIQFDDTDGDGSEDSYVKRAKVCGVNCDGENNPDILDIYKIEDIFAGEQITIKFASREDDEGDYDLRMYYREDYDLSSGLNYSYYEIDDSGDWDSNDHVETYQHTMDKSGDLYVWFQGGFDSDTNDYQSYTVEFFPKTGVIIETADLDNDGMGDAEEFRCGSDYRDPSDIAPNYDGDDKCDQFDTDDDNDGIDDIYDENCQFSPMDEEDYDNDGCTDYTEDVDDDNDGVTDFSDYCPTSVKNNDGIDTDGDGCFNNEDDDDDDDAWFDTEEIDCQTDPLDWFSQPADFDSDWYCDLIDNDDDNDEIFDILDDCQFSDWFTVDKSEIPFTYTPTDVDTDGDGCFDREDDDDDEDGILDEDDACPTGLNFGQDLDDDGCFDEEDDDIDGDGFSNDDEEVCGSDERDSNDVPNDMDLDTQCDAIDDDIDGDGVGNPYDKFPTDPTETKDTDNDGIGNNVDNDDDGDGYTDEIDDLPLDATEWIDTDGDNIGNNMDNDDDGDGWLDSEEDACTTDSLNSADIPIDTDGDGDCNRLDDDDDGDGINDIEEIGCGTDPLRFTEDFPDHDSDGSCDLMDEDDDNDGIDDVDDLTCPKGASSGTDFDNDGCFDSEDPDIDGDGVMNNADECDKEVADTSDGCKEQTWWQANKGLLFGGGTVAAILILVGGLFMTKMVRIGAAAAKDVGSLGVSQYNDNSRTRVTQMMNSGNRTSLTDSLNQHSIKMDNSAISDVGNTRGGDTVNATNSNVNTGSGDQSGSTNK